jgi:hypothetical protein
MMLPPRHFLRWLVSFTGFPLGGLLVFALFPVDGVWSALAGGALAGAVLGAVQWACGRPLGLPPSWVAATSAGLALGSGLAALLAGTGPDLSRLVLFGAVAGAVVGVAQGLSLTREPLQVAAWSAVVAGAWAVGWAVTTSIGVDVERGYVLFGSSGAVVATALLGLALPVVLRPVPVRAEA